MRNKRANHIVRKSYINGINRDPRLLYARKITNNEDEDIEALDDAYKLTSNINSTICFSQVIAIIFLAAFTCVGLYLIFYYFSWPVSYQLEEFSSGLYVTTGPNQAHFSLTNEGGFRVVFC